MTHVYLSRWAEPVDEWDAYHPVIADQLADEGAGYGLIDLRADATAVDGWALVGSDARVDVAGAVYLGDTPDDTTPTVLRRAIDNRLGVTLPVGLSLRRLVRELLIVEADDRPLGQRTRWPQLKPSARRNLYRVCLAGREWDTWASARGGATVTDDFNRANADPPGSPWTETSGSTWRIGSNRLEWEGTIGYIRNDTDVGSDDMYAEAEGSFVDAVTNNQVGVQCRMSTTGGSNGYMAFLDHPVTGSSMPAFRTSGFRIRRTTSGSRTDIVTVNTTIHTTFKLRIEADGSDVDASYWPAVSGTEETLSGTDIQISTGERGGFYANFDAWYDNFEAGDLVAFSTVNGTATAAFTYAAPASGVPTTPGTGAAAFAFAAPAAGTRTTAATGSAAFTFSAPASGAVVEPGTADAAFTFAAPAAGTVTVNGAAPAALTFTAPAAGTVTHPATAAATFSFAAPAVGLVTVAGTATAAFAFAAPASGEVQGEVEGTATADFAYAAPAVGLVVVNGAAATALVFAAPVQGTVAVEGAAAAAFTFAAPASGTPSTLGTGDASFTYTAPASGTVVHPATATAAFAYAAAAQGSVTVSGQATAALEFAAPAVGEVEGEVSGAATAAFTYTATAAGSVIVNGSSSTDLVFAAPAAGTRTTAGTASAVLVFAAPAAGVVEGEQVTGVASAAFAFSASSSGTVAHPATGTATLTFTAPAQGAVTHPATAAAAFTFAAPALGVGTGVVEGAATAAFTFAAAVVVITVRYARATTARRPAAHTEARRKAAVS